MSLDVLSEAPILRGLVGYVAHCVSAANEGEDYAVSRAVLDALTTLEFMEKVGPGRWAPTAGAAQFLAAMNRAPSTGEITLSAEGQGLIAQAIAAHAFVVGALTVGRPDLALAEARKWTEGFMQAAAIARGTDEEAGAA